MQELMTTASLVENSALDADNSITAVLARSELEAALNSEDSAQLWLELGYEEYEEIKRLTMALDSGDLERMLQRSTGAEIVLALDRNAVRGLLDEPEVEAHGLRGALAIAVTTAAVVAPAGHAAVAETAGVATALQGKGVASTVEVSHGVASTVEVSHGVASTVEVSHGIAKAELANKVAKSLVVRASGLKLVHSGLVH